MSTAQTFCLAAGSLATSIAAYSYLVSYPHHVLSPVQFFFKNRNTQVFPLEQNISDRHRQIATGRESLETYLTHGAFVQSVAGYAYFLIRNRRKSLASGGLYSSFLAASLLASAYAFVKTDAPCGLPGRTAYDEDADDEKYDSDSGPCGSQDESAQALEKQKMAAFFCFNNMWGISVSHFVQSFFPHARLGLLLPMAIPAFGLAGHTVSLSYNKPRNGEPSDYKQIVAWYYSNETVASLAILSAGVGMLFGYGLVNLARLTTLGRAAGGVLGTERVAGDFKQIASLTFSLSAMIPFFVYQSMLLYGRDLHRDPQQNYNRWDSAFCYLWREVPQVFIPVDYYLRNSMHKQNIERIDTKLKRAPSSNDGNSSGPK